MAIEVVRLGHARTALFLLTGLSSYARPSEGKAGTAVVGLRLYPLLEHLLPSRPQPQVEPDAVSTSSVGTFDRSSSRHKEPFGGSKVQKRGRWKSFRSVSRYEKSARLAANFGQLSRSLQVHCHQAESQLGDVMLGRRRPLLPPGADAMYANMLPISSLDAGELHGVAGCWATRPRNSM